MKNKNLMCLCSILILCTTNEKLFSQATTDNTQAFTTDFLGWNTLGLSNQPLNIKTEQNQPILFYTNSGADPLWRKSDGLTCVKGTCASELLKFTSLLLNEWKI